MRTLITCAVFQLIVQVLPAAAPKPVSNSSTRTLTSPAAPGWTAHTTMTPDISSTWIPATSAVPGGLAATVPNSPTSLPDDAVRRPSSPNLPTTTQGNTPLPKTTSTDNRVISSEIKLLIGTILFILIVLFAIASTSIYLLFKTSSIKRMLRQDHKKRPRRIDPVLPTFQRDLELLPRRPRGSNQLPDRGAGKPMILPELILPPGTDTYILSIHLLHPLALTTQLPPQPAAVSYRNQQGGSGGYVRLAVEDPEFAVNME